MITGLVQVCFELGWKSGFALGFPGFIGIVPIYPRVKIELG